MREKVTALVLASRVKGEARRGQATAPAAEIITATHETGRLIFVTAGPLGQVAGRAVFRLLAAI